MSEDKSLKKFTPFDKGIKLVSKPNDIDDCDDDPSVLRAVLSCGHVTDPETLTDCCKAQLDKGCAEFRCPLCKKEWPYKEVRKLAKLTVDEQSIFEEKLGTNTVKKLLDFRNCPGCDILIERLDHFDLCVVCSVCTAKNKKHFQFCWKCMREWKGSENPAEKCGNVGCSFDQKLLADCPMIALEYFDGEVECPKIRKCPHCDTLIEHTNDGCNNMLCPQCNIEFCFVCLEAAHDYNPLNLCNVAPRQINSGF